MCFYLMKSIRWWLKYDLVSWSKYFSQIFSYSSFLVLEQPPYFMRHYFYNPLIVNFFKACSYVPFPSHFILFPSNLSHALGLKVPPICSFRDCSYLFCDYLNIVSLTFKMMLSEFHLVSIVPFMAGRMYLLFLSQFWGRFPLFLYSFAQPTGY